MRLAYVDRSQSEIFASQLQLIKFTDRGRRFQFLRDRIKACYIRTILLVYSITLQQTIFTSNTDSVV